MKWFYLSFVDASYPRGEQFRGGCIVQGEDMADACHQAHVRGCNSGGEVLGLELVSRPPFVMPTNVLLNKEQIRATGPVMTGKELREKMGG